MKYLSQNIAVFWTQEKFTYALKVFIALAIATMYCSESTRLSMLPSLYLGILTCIISETDNHWIGQLKTNVVAVICFAISSISVLLLFQYPLFFILGLGLSTIAWILLGSLGERYTAIAIATMTVAIFTMLTMDKYSGHVNSETWRNVRVMLIGASSYGLLSVLWNAIFTHNPIRENLAQTFFALRKLIQLQTERTDFKLRQQPASHFAIAKQNAAVIHALSQARDTIIRRFNQSQQSKMRFLHLFELFQLAQETYEHLRFITLPDLTIHPELADSNLAQHLLKLFHLQARALLCLATATRAGQRFVYPPHHQFAYLQVRSLLDALLAQYREGSQALIRDLHLCELAFNHFSAVHQRMHDFANVRTNTVPDANLLPTPSAFSWKEIAHRLFENFSKSSVFFRFGLRLSVALSIAYIFIHLVQVENKYWVLLTILFVCRPTYGATRLRLIERILGTLIGLILSWVLSAIFPYPNMHLVFALLGSFIFSITRINQYMIATVAVTVMVIFCFNFAGDKTLLLWSRFVDTLIGCVIVGICSVFIFPDWQEKHLYQVCRRILQHAAQCLTTLRDLLHGKEIEHNAYRNALRDIQNASALLSTVLSNMTHEPTHFRRRTIDSGLEFLVLSNTQIEYLSTCATLAPMCHIHSKALLIAASDYARETMIALTTKLSSNQKRSTIALEHIQQLTHDLEHAILPSDTTSLRALYSALAALLDLLPRIDACTSALLHIRENPPARQ